MKLSLIFSFLFLLACGEADCQIAIRKGLYDSLTTQNKLNPKRAESYNYIFSKVEVIADFNKGFKKWFEYANMHFDFNKVANSLPDSLSHFQDSVKVFFIVTKKGEVKNINFLSGNKLLFEPFSGLLLKSPNWRPATQGGRNVYSFRVLSIDVMIDKLKGEQKVLTKINSYFDNTYLTFVD